MALFESIGDCHRLANFTSRRETTRFKQTVGCASESGHYDERLFRYSFSNNRAGTINCRGVFQRRAAELHHNHRRSNLAHTNSGTGH